MPIRPSGSTASRRPAVLTACGARGSAHRGAPAARTIDRLGEPSTLAKSHEIHSIGNLQGQWQQHVHGEIFDKREGAELFIYESTFATKGYSGGGVFTDRWELVGMIIDDYDPKTIRAISIDAIIAKATSWGATVGLTRPAAAPGFQRIGTWPPNAQPGGTYTAKAAERRLEIGTLRLPDRFTLLVDPTVASYDWRVGTLEFGKGATIDLSAAPAPRRQADKGQDTGGQPSWCIPGRAGQDGRHGARGRSAPSLTLTVDHKADVGSLWIRGDGGSGGDGGDGGRGQTGGGSTCTPRELDQRLDLRVSDLDVELVELAWGGRTGYPPCLISRLSLISGTSNLHRKASSYGSWRISTSS